MCEDAGIGFTAEIAQGCRIAGERDLISIPPGVYREETNIGDEDALMCVMLGAAKPITPVYPPDSPLTKIKRDKK